MIKKFLIVLAFLIIVYAVVSFSVSYQVYSTVQNNIGKKQHYYTVDSVLNEYLSQRLDPTIKKAPITEDDEYFSLRYQYEMSFPFTWHVFFKANSKYSRTYKLYMINLDGTEELIQAEVNNMIDVKLVFSNWKWNIIDAIRMD